MHGPRALILHGSVGVFVRRSQALLVYPEISRNIPVNKLWPRFYPKCGVSNRIAEIDSYRQYKEGFPKDPSRRLPSRHRTSLERTILPNL